jgi:hypothetical protein
MLVIVFAGLPFDLILHHNLLKVEFTTIKLGIAAKVLFGAYGTVRTTVSAGRTFLKLQFFHYFLSLVDQEQYHVICLSG